MNRVFFFALLVRGIVSFSVYGGDVEVAPPPREVRPDGTREPAPEPMNPKAQNPLETVERIIKNSKAVGDKLAMTDTGTDTRKTQDTILKDIQSLIDMQENPPPPKSGQSPDMNMDQKDNQSNNKDKNNDQKENKPNDKDNKNDPMPMNGKNDMPPQKKDMQPNGGMDQRPMNDSDQPKGRKPRQQQDGNQSKEKEDKPMNPDKNSGGTKEIAKGSGTASKKPNQGMGRLPDPMNKQNMTPTTPSLPPEEAAVKDVWGYLPDKLRQQALQYYKQEFMPHYAKLLEQYYSSLSEKGMKK